MLPKNYQHFPLFHFRKIHVSSFSWLQIWGLRHAQITHIQHQSDRVFANSVQSVQGWQSRSVLLGRRTKFVQTARVHHTRNWPHWVWRWNWSIRVSVFLSAVALGLYALKLFLSHTKDLPTVQGTSGVFPFLTDFAWIRNLENEIRARENCGRTKKVDIHQHENLETREM